MSRTCQYLSNGIESVKVSSVKLTSPGLVNTCQMVQNRPRSCFKGFPRFPEAWKTLLSRRRSSWQSSGPSHVQMLVRARRWISQLPGTSARRHVGRANHPARRVSPARWRVLRARRARSPWVARAIQRTEFPRESLARLWRSVLASLAQCTLDNQPTQARWQTCAAAQLDNVRRI